jgi:two-component system response regulator AlgR
VRIHRNALVAEKHIAAIDRGDDGQYTVRMRDCDVALQVSRRHATELLRRVKGT